MDISVASFLVDVGSLELTEQESKNVTILLKIESEFEKVGDYSYKILKIIDNMNENEQKFSNIADKDLKVMYNLAEDILFRTLKLIRDKDFSDI